MKASDSPLAAAQGLRRALEQPLHAYADLFVEQLMMAPQLLPDFPLGLLRRLSVARPAPAARYLDRLATDIDAAKSSEKRDQTVLRVCGLGVSEVCTLALLSHALGQSLGESELKALTLTEATGRGMESASTDLIQIIREHSRLRANPTTPPARAGESPEAADLPPRTLIDVADETLSRSFERLSVLLNHLQAHTCHLLLTAGPYLPPATRRSWGGS